MSWDLFEDTYKSSNTNLLQNISERLFRQFIWQPAVIPIWIFDQIQVLESKGNLKNPMLKFTTIAVSSIEMPIRQDSLSAAPHKTDKTNIP